MPAPADLVALSRAREVVAAVDAARGGVDGLLATLASPPLRARRAELSEQLVRRDAWAGAALDGAPLPTGWDEVGAPVPEPVGPAAAELRCAVASVRAARGLGGAPGQVLARLHTVVAADRVTAAELGRPRPGADTARLAALAQLLAAGDPTVPAVVAAAVAQAELVAVAPFSWGDAVVARGLFRAVTAQRGLDVAGVVPVAAGHLRLGVGRTAQLLAAYAASDDPLAGPGLDWVAHCGQALAVGAGDVVARLSGPGAAPG